MGTIVVAMGSRAKHVSQERFMIAEVVAKGRRQKPRPPPSR